MLSVLSVLLALLVVLLTDLYALYVNFYHLICDILGQSLFLITRTDDMFFTGKSW